MIIMLRYKTLQKTNHNTFSFAKSCQVNGSEMTEYRVYTIQLQVTMKISTSEL